MTESDLLAAILLRFGSLPTLRLFRMNVLVARTSTGRVVKAGIKGQADIFGILAPSGRHISIETKAPHGRQSPEQKRWQAMVERMGGIYCLARSTDDVERALLGATT